VATVLCLEPPTLHVAETVRRAEVTRGGAYAR
jgi:hypothetical protein